MRSVPESELKTVLRNGRGLRGCNAQPNFGAVGWYFSFVVRTTKRASNGWPEGTRWTCRSWIFVQVWTDFLFVLGLRCSKK